MFLSSHDVESMSVLVTATSVAREKIIITSHQTVDLVSVKMQVNPTTYIFLTEVIRIVSFTGALQRFISLYY